MVATSNSILHQNENYYNESLYHECRRQPRQYQTASGVILSIELKKFHPLLYQRILFIPREKPVQRTV